MQTEISSSSIRTVRCANKTSYNTKDKCKKNKDIDEDKDIEEDDEIATIPELE